MTLLLLAAAALLAAPSQPFIAPPRPPAASPVRLPPLAPGEVLLEVDGVAAVHTQATSASLTVLVYGEGATPADARAVLDGEIRQVAAAAREADVGPAEWTVVPHGPADTLGLAHVPTRGRPHVLSAQVVVRLARAAAAPVLRARLGGSEDPVYELADSDAARREVRRLALADARADADAYAAALGMRIVRTLRVTDRFEFDGPAMSVTEAGKVAQARWNARTLPHHVTTEVVLGVDYVLAPR